MARLIESLAKSADVRVLSLNPKKHHSETRRDVIDIDTARIVTPMLRAMTSDVPFVVARFYSREFNEQIIATLSEFQPDVVQIESPFLLPYLRTIRTHSNAFVSLRSLNVEFRIWEELARTQNSIAKKFVARSLRNYELRQLNATDALISISLDDANDFRNLGCTIPIHVAPCGVPLPPISQQEPEPNTVGFIGALDYQPNQQAVHWIFDELWPRVAARAPHAKLTISGSNPPPSLRERVITAPDAQEFMRSQSVMIAPLLSGGGMRIKVLEALALGKPIVATTRGAGGVEFTPGRELLIADDVDSFADAVVRLLEDAEERRRLGEAARALVRETYDPDAIGREVLGFYRERVKGKN